MVKNRTIVRYGVSLQAARDSRWDGKSLGKGNSPSDRPKTERAAMAKGHVYIVVERCKACGFCVEFCPTHVLALSSAFNSKGYHPPHVINPEKCSGCDLCGMYCPDFAIYGVKATPGGAK